MDEQINSEPQHAIPSANNTATGNEHSDCPHKHDCSNCPLKKQYDLLNKDCK